MPDFGHDAARVGDLIADVLHRAGERHAAGAPATDLWISLAQSGRATHLASLTGTYATAVAQNSDRPTHAEQRDALLDLAAGSLLALLAHDKYTL